MLVIGIAGGIACGKSFVARQFERLGAVVVDVDRLGHEVLLDPTVLEAIRNQWGAQVFDEEGAVDRKALAAVVFAADGQDQLEILERITHPRISDLLNQELARLRKEKVPAVVVDAPVMFKAGWDKVCDKIVFVDAPFAVRNERAMKNRNWSKDELRSREQRQMPLAEKQKRATDSIDNSGTVEATIQQVAEIWTQWGLQIPSQLIDLPKP